MLGDTDGCSGLLGQVGLLDLRGQRNQEQLPSREVPQGPELVSPNILVILAVQDHDVLVARVCGVVEIVVVVEVAVVVVVVVSVMCLLVLLYRFVC